MSQPDVLIAGAGLAGLCCARRLHQEGVTFQLIEAADEVGGRVRTAVVDGFRLDRGFQVLLTAYPEAQAVLDYDALELCAFAPGVLVRQAGQFHRLSDPWREPGSWLRNLASPAGSVMDKFRMSRLRADVLGRSIEQIFSAPEMSTRQALERRRFSHRFIEEFFRPWFGGIQLDPKLGASSRMFEFVFRMMAEGEAAVPALGMGEIPRQIAAALPADSIRLNARVEAVEPGKLTLAEGEELTARSIVLATEGPEANRLLKLRVSVPSRSVTCLYFAASSSPMEEAMLVLGGSGRGLINNMAVMSLVSPGYAPEGKHLISVSVLGLPSRDERTLVNNVTSQLKRWFGIQAVHWQFLRAYFIEHAQPVVVPLGWTQPVRVQPGLYAAGDYRATPSIQGAMESGRLAAEALLRDLRGEPDPDPEAAASHTARPAPKTPATPSGPEPEIPA